MSRRNMRKNELLFREIGDKIYFIRGYRVMLDSDLADLYGVETKNLNKAVKRNLKRFPDDFMFQLTEEEHEILRFQIGTLRFEHGGHKKYLPYVFTQEGISMLSGVLRSDRAIEVNIAIMRTFVKLREILETNKDVAKRIDQLEAKYDGQFKIVFDAIRKLMLAGTPGTQKKIRTLGEK